MRSSKNLIINYIDVKSKQFRFIIRARRVVCSTTTGKYVKKETVFMQQSPFY